MGFLKKLGFAFLIIMTVLAFLLFVFLFPKGISYLFNSIRLMGTENSGEPLGGVILFFVSLLYISIATTHVPVLAFLWAVVISHRKEKKDREEKEGDAQTPPL